MACLQTTSDVENVSFLSAFVISQPIKDVITNRHDKLNRLMIVQTPELFSANFFYNWLMNVEDIASQISVFSVYTA